MTKKLIEKRYNRVLNILLGVYVVLCLVFALLFNGFFVKPKAFTDGTNYIISYNLIAYDDANCQTSVKYSWSGNSKYIFYYDDDFNDILNSVVSANLNKQVTCSCIRISKTNQDSIIGGSVSTSVVSQLGPYSAAAQQIYAISFDNSTIYNYFRDKGYALDPVAGYPYWVNFVVNGSDINSNKVIGGELVSEDVQYIDSPENLYKYMVENNDDVVKEGNPNKVTLDNTLPLPQKVSISEVPIVAPYVPSGQNGASIQASWVNPNKFGDDDLNELCVQVKFSATYKAYSSILGIPKGKFNTPFTDVKTININNPNVNKMIDHYISYGINDIPMSIVIDSQGYNKTFTSYEDTALFNNVTSTFSSNGLDPFGYTPNHTVYELIKGTKFSIRYKLGNKVSYWVDVNYSGNNVTSNETTFSDNNNKSVDPEDVNYDYAANSINPNDNSLSIMNFFDKLSSNIGSIFSSTNQYFDDASQGTGSFFNFFKAFWDEFPAFFALLLLGLVIAILLRILGR